MNTNKARWFAFLASIWLAAPSIVAAAVLITNDTAVGPFDLGYEGESIVVSNCTLTVDGAHSFAALSLIDGAELNHSFVVGSISNIVSVTNEVVVFGDTNPVPLLNFNVLAGSILVTDSGATVFYTNDVDYLLVDLGNGVTGIQRTATSTIPEGGSVWVSYNYVASVWSAGIQLNVAGKLEVDPSARIDVSGRGYPGDAGPGSGGEAGGLRTGAGAGHGGRGGLSSSNALGGVAYDVPESPAMQGSGGGLGTTGPGGAGGGLIRLIVGGDLLVQGVIVADGLNGTNSRSGGGSGGSIWITAQTLSGDGLISAKGGNGEPIHGGGGGGGRIALEFGTNAFTGAIQAYGGTGFQRGGAGTLFTRVQGQNKAIVTLDNNDALGADTPLFLKNAAELELSVTRGAVGSLSSSQVLSALSVHSNGWISVVNPVAPCILAVNGDARLYPGGGINVIGKGYPYNEGPGRGFAGGSGATYAGGGGGYAGYGGMGVLTNISRGGTYYGIVADANFPGSGGGGTPTYPGGAGGGYVRLTVNRTLYMDGLIAADGEAPRGIVAGGGSGGSVYISARTISGAGRISADGGSAYDSVGGGGSGGRIAIYFDTNLFTGAVSATGGTGYQNGAAGTVFSKANTASIPQIVLDNGGRFGTNTVLSSAGTLDLSVLGGAVATAPPSSFQNLTIGSNSTLALSGMNQTISVNKDARIEGGGRLSMDGMGFPYNQGFSSYSYGTYTRGSSPDYSGSGGGGAHGGDGGYGLAGSKGARPGAAYGNLSSPQYPGSGGGGDYQFPGGAGGGALVLDVKGLFHLDGRVSSDGQDALGSGAGGGAGGSIRLVLNRWSGNGVVSANGGNGELPNGGGGGGGRIAVYYTSNAFTGTITARGGNGFCPGGAGTIYLKRNVENVAQAVLNNGGLKGANSYLGIGGNPPLDLTIVGGASLSNGPSTSLALRNLYLGSNSWLRLYGTALAYMGVNVTGDAMIEAGAGIFADGTGYPANQGNAGGAGRYYSSYYSGGGGGHGGNGGNGSMAAQGAVGGLANDNSIIQPLYAGSGGGAYYGTSGSEGGGIVRATVNGMLTLNGTITANGAGGQPSGGGGGAGGSIWLTVGKLTGTGSMSADGGSGDLPAGGGGGGGRIAVYYNTNSFVGILSAKGGVGATTGGAGTIYIRRSNQNTGQLLVDNGGQKGTNTVIFPFSGGDLVVKGAARAVLVQSLIVPALEVQSNSMIVMSNAYLTVNGNAMVHSGAGILADGAGYGPATGPGAGSNSLTPKGGGSHGGLGGANPVASASGTVNGPTTWGSGGANGSGTTVAPFGGAGGASARVTVIGTLTLDGRISANGSDGGVNSGGGAGGSVWLTVGTLAGAGTVSANGGAGSGTGGGGGGGRIAIHYRNNLFAGPLQASGGAGSIAGGAGTIYLTEIGTANQSLLVNNRGQRGARTPLSGLSSGLKLTVADGAVAYPLQEFPLFDSVTVNEAGAIASRNILDPLKLATIGNVNILPGGAITADAMGYLGGAGPGLGAILGSEGGGGGYGGKGGASASGAAGGVTYGSESQPVDSGSGGGTPMQPGGSEGGGAIFLNVGGTLNVGGRLSSDGNSGLSDNAGGGSGGSIWVRAGSVTGEGIVSASGGFGELLNGGGGGGGRIALYSPANTHTGLVSVAGGFGAHDGEHGTVFLSAQMPGFEVLSHSPSGLVTDVVSMVTFSLSDIVNPASVSAEDFVLLTPLGVETNLIAAASGLQTLSVSFPALNVPGEYRLTAGPGLENLFGIALLEPYVATFTVELPFISGMVTNLNGQPVAGALVGAEDPEWVPAVTGANGVYTLYLPPWWSGNVAPTSDTHVFIPRVRFYGTLTASVTNQDYLVVDSIVPQVQSAVAGTNMWLGWQGIPGIQYRVLSSTNLADWYTSGETLPGTNGPMQFSAPIDKPIEFFRLEVGN